MSHAQSQRQHGCSIEIKQTGEFTAPLLKMQIPLEQRLIEGGRLDEVEECLRKAANDSTLVSDDERTIASKSVLLRNMSRYFEDLFRGKPEGVVEYRIETSMSFSILELLVKFFEAGELELSLHNVEEALAAAHCLRADRLLELCKDFALDHRPDTDDILVRLASLLGDMGDLTTKAAIICAKYFDKYKESLLNSSAQFLATVVSQDNLRVSTEDQVANLIIEWDEQEEPSQQEVLQVLECVRYPHLSPVVFKKLLNHFKVAKKVSYVQLCVEKRLGEMPAEQLTRRKFYSDHMHLIWRKSSSREYRLTCLLCSEGQVVSHDLICKIPDLHNKSYCKSSKFISVMNSLQFVTCSVASRSLVVYRQGLGSNWVTQTTVPRIPTPHDFEVRLHRAKIILNENRLLATHLTKIDSLTEDKMNFKSLKFRFNGRLYDKRSVSLSGYNDDYVVFWQWNPSQLVVHILDKDTNRYSWLYLTTPISKNGLRCIDSLIGPDNYLYILLEYGQKSTKKLPLFGTLYRVDLFTTSLQSTVKFPNGWIDNVGGSSRLMTSGAKVLLGSPDMKKNACQISQLLTDRRRFAVLGYVNCTNEDLQDIDFRHLECAVPIHIHSCSHETLLKTFCSQLHGPENCALLERLALYL